MDALSAPFPDEAPSNEAESGGADRAHRRQSRRRSGSSSLPTRDEILQRLDALPRLVLAGLLTPQQCNSIKSALQALLNAISPSSSGRVGSAPSAEFDVNRWREILQRFPEAADDLERFWGADAVDQLFSDQSEEGTSA